jgi:hypothetical protein
MGELRRYLLLKAYGYALLAVLAAAAPLITEPDQFGFCFVMGLSFLFATMSYFCFRNARKARDEERVDAPPVGASVAEQIAYYKRFLGATLVIFPIYTVITVIQLNALESGNDQSVALWIPVSLLYNWGGYWVAILSVPLMGVLISYVWLWKIRKIREGVKHN